MSAIRDEVLERHAQHRDPCLAYRVAVEARDEIDQLARKASAALDRVRAIHQPLDAVMYVGSRQYMRRVCTGCGTDDGNWQIWPCPTIRAIDQEATA